MANKKVLKNNNKHEEKDRDFPKLEKDLDIIFENKNLLIQAFIHRSYINENSSFKLGHNERLEFLGDAVLELVSTNYLYNKFQDLAEGELTSYRAALVNTKSIGSVARELGFNDYLFLSKGESKDFGKARLSILADTYEAFIGAVFLDKGYDFAKSFIEKTLLTHTDEVVEAGKYKDAKSVVQEKSQDILSVTPSYKVLSESGPDHDKKFIVGIYFGEEKVAEGEGRSKQEAETRAAKEALIKKKWNK
ncbi:Ribonuclease 3 [bioreactor metagenome]|uniref:ribonuclease III n=1 Tax=bioreactor metagenome TaxID=1076179 RepID=A0A644T6F4_9ZZZZ|nr:ribonuclease III [Candidatus Elulimicrobiales bacterium]